MRVISGTLRGRTIRGDKINGTRPTMDSVKQSLFAMIQNNIRDAICLDLFAGSGSLGIEAISNGAAYAYFVDKNKECYSVIKNNLQIFKIEDKAKVILDDYMKALFYFKNNHVKFNLIFLDPPYKEKFINDILKFIDANDLLHHNGQVICEFNSEQLDDTYGHLVVIKERQYGDKTVKIYANNR
jgi:16S rRNA (guanine(966)-N(2))-methyltransferase RsmD